MSRTAPEDWLKICPHLTIGTPFGDPCLSFDENELEQIAAGLHQRGYFSVPGRFERQEIAPILNGMRCLKDHSIPPVYIYLYDQPWFLFEKLKTLLSYILGEQYALLPNFWAWHLTSAGEQGWPIHRDCDAQTVFDMGEDRLLMSLSLWIPLTDVDEQNGCMHVVEYPKEKALQKAGIEAEDMLKAATALPAPAGSVLGWPQDVLHFGGTYTEQAQNERASLSFEFQNTAFDPLATPLLDTSSPPPFEQRLELLSLQIEKYKHINQG
ncbi:phytanoyl-CoA dioxygenase family protein [Sneathiella glossodoripedis]|uniref:phytanoyl-CoA dioxygenase family protein n=1 Tax=Sneathiella glossodoripedis TaxID=418853 RepID=UPI0004700E69|nr:phytanoyl-CoA dioxygenase family protein [Sneathiella glossodoripedis]